MIFGITTRSHWVSWRAHPSRPPGCGWPSPAHPATSSKYRPPKRLIRAIAEVAEGRGYVTSLLAKDLIAILLEARGQASGESPLTPRQREVLQLIAEGRTMKEVATILHISPRTAESHKYEIMQVLGVETTAALIQYAIRLKLVAE